MSCYIAAMTRTGISDDIWQQLDRDAGRMSRRTFRRLGIAAVAVLLLGGAVTAGWTSAVSPLATDERASDSAETSVAPPSFQTTFEVRNRGLVPVTIVGVGRDGPGLKMSGPGMSLPLTVQPGANITVAITYSITDCSAYIRDPWPLPIRIDRPWGEQTVYVSPPALLDSGAPSSYSYSGDRDPYALEWQDGLAHMACKPFG